MPQRFLRPGITTSDNWNAVSFPAQSLYIRIITLVDDFGRCDARVPILHGQCFALRPEMKPQQTAALRSELNDAGLITVYLVDGKEYLQIEKWQERARCDASKFPNNPGPAADGSGPQESAASLAITSSPLHPRSNTIAIASSTAPLRGAAKPCGFVIPENLGSIEGFGQALTGWLESRKKLGKPATPHAVQLTLADLAKTPDKAVAALEEAIKRGWTGVKVEWLDREKKGNAKTKPNPLAGMRPV